MHEFPTDSHGIIFRRAAIDHGFTDSQLARAVADKKLTRIWPGALIAASAVPAKPEELHRLKARAAAELCGGTALSHESAGLLHGLSLLRPRLARVHFSTGFTTGGRVEKRRHLHSGALEDRDTTVFDGVGVTTLERTAIDIACSAGFPEALAVLDSALRLGADAEVLAHLLDGRHRRSVAFARRALTHADAGAQNAGESWGRAQIIVAGLPVPRLQHKFYNSHGDFIAQTDYDWLGKLVAEFDGMTKYQSHLEPGETPFDAMRREKEREDALRRLGIMVIRWVWKDLQRGPVVPMVREWLDRLGLTPHPTHPMYAQRTLAYSCNRW
ncbi:hypothetical protein [Gordonia rhizosphera]|uniref:AbiEi antitoxin C-terminal domain-containing protein n=1 Tax=Gordonia rhizosphera NBRC 16068 TaxID=1108045 RepID=K6VC04_9ACTN|nr:hypothetical protein [Gordonia rhizosphera]GAB93743.1 hypothetical protein GORHZ_243_00170 [Gordonia rhizosphera NBRC 16068]